MTAEEKNERISKITGKAKADFYSETINTMRWEHENSEIRHERREKRFFTIIIILIVLLVGTNLGWLIYESQFEEMTTTETITYEAEQETENGNNTNFMNGGDVIDGAPENKKDNQ